MNGDFIKAKVAFGELTLGEVYDLVENRCSLIDVYEGDVGKRSYEVFSHDQNGLYLFDGEDANRPDYSFDAKVKVKVRDQSVEFKWKGVEMSLRFLESRPISLGSLLPRK